jgi:hypothetical protein
MSHPNATVEDNGNTNAHLSLSEKGPKTMSVGTKSLHYDGPISPRAPDGPGVGPRDAYDSLPRWRAAIRNALLESLDWQSTVLANMQVGFATHQMCQLG